MGFSNGSTDFKKLKRKYFDLKKYTPQEIIRGCKKQNPRFQKALVVQYSGLLMAVSRRYSKDQSSSKDVLQEALIHILNSISSYEEKGSFEGWMKRIVINIAIKYFRNKSFKNELYTIEDHPENMVEPSAYSSMAAAELMEVIDRLPDSYRTIFNLYAIEGFTHREIGEMLEITESTSRSQLARARASLKKILIKEGKIKLRI